MAKKPKPGTAVEAAAPILEAEALDPTAEQVRKELTIFWDAFSPLSLAAVRAAHDSAKSLDDIGITEGQAETFVNKYNSIVLRNPGKGPLVRSTEAKAWHTSKMPDITAEVTKRAAR